MPWGRTPAHGCVVSWCASRRHVGCGLSRSSSMLILLCVCHGKCWCCTRDSGIPLNTPLPHLHLSDQVPGHSTSSTRADQAKIKQHAVLNRDRRERGRSATGLLLIFTPSDAMCVTIRRVDDAPRDMPPTPDIFPGTVMSSPKSLAILCPWNLPRRTTHPRALIEPRTIYPPSDLMFPDTRSL
jgi:hypothetical protein